MIAWVIDTAVTSGLFDRVVVSTDSTDIARVAEAAGAEVPFVRPASLSDAHTPLLPVMRHAVDTLELPPPAPVALLFATAVGLSAVDIEQGLAVITGRPDVDYALGVVRFAHPIQRALVLDEANRVSLLDPRQAEVRTQDLGPRWYDAGQFVCGRAASWRGDAPVLTRAVGIEVPSWRCVDVDTEEDLQRAAVVLDVLASG